MSLQQAEGDSAVYNHVADCKAKSGEWTKIENVAFTIPEKEGDLFLYFETPEDSGNLCDFYVDQVQASKAYIPSKVVTGQGVVESLETDPRDGLSKDGIIRIMPVGDSITFGLGDTGGYRKYLHHFLREKGYTQIDMVGLRERSRLHSITMARIYVTMIIMRVTADILSFRSILSPAGARTVSLKSSGARMQLPVQSPISYCL